MAGHSKWKNIKHKKAATDAAKARHFTKLLKEITVSARESGGDTESNPRLRTLIHKAHEMNMPKENYIRAIKKGTGEIASAQYESNIYEGYGPHGIAVMVEILSDNKNRAASEIRTAFERNGGSIGGIGSVSWMFERSGIITIVNAPFNEEECVEALNNCKVYDIENNEGIYTIFCDPSDLQKIQKVIVDIGGTVEDPHIGFKAKDYIIAEEIEMERITNFLGAIEDLDDVRHLYVNIA